LDRTTTLYIDQNVVEMPHGRPRKYDDDFHRKLRAKVAAHRKRKAAEIALRSQRRALERGRKPQESRALYRLYERVASDAVDVVLVREGDTVPSGYAVGDWLPAGLVNYRLGRSLRIMRMRQLVEWLRNAADGN